MSSGGARTRSGPPPDPRSLNSANRGAVFTQLPAEGFAGDVPTFPLPEPTERELQLWEWVWRTPQACVWVDDPWRHHSVAMWVRTAVVCEGSEATAADKGSLHRFADQIGMTPAGLRFNGWEIAATKAPAGRAAPKAARRSSRTRLLAAVPDVAPG